MADLPEVKFKIGVVGEDAAKKAFRSVAQSAEKAREKEYRQLVKTIEKEEAAIKKSEQSKLQAQEKADQKRLRDLEQAKEKEFRELERWAQKEERLLSRQSASRAPGSSQVGANNGSGRKGGSGGGSGLLRGAGMLYIGTFIADQFRKALEPFQQAATDLATAIMQVGGARSISDSITAGIHEQHLAKQIMYSVPGSERLTSGEIKGLATKTSNGSVYTREEILNAIGSYGEIAGKQKELGNGTLQTIIGANQLTGGDLSTTTRMIARMRIGNPNMTDSQFQQMIMNTIAQGREGSIGFQNMESATPALANANMFGIADKVKQAQMSVGLVQAAGTILSPDEAGTAVSRLEDEIMKKNTDISAALGHNIVTHDSTGATVMKDARGDIARMALMQQQNPGALGVDVRAGKVLTSLYSGAGIKAGDTNAQQLTKIEAYIDKFSDVSMTTDQFNKELGDLNDDVESKLKVTFNQLNNTVADKLLPVVADLVPYVKQLADAFVEYLPVFGDVGDIFKYGLLTLGPLFEMLTIGAMGLTAALGYSAAIGVATFKELAEGIRYLFHKLGLSTDSLDDFIDKSQELQDNLEKFSFAMVKGAVDIDQATQRAFDKLSNAGKPQDASTESELANNALGIANAGVGQNSQSVHDRLLSDFFKDNMMMDPNYKPSNKELVDNEMKNHFKTVAKDVGTQLAQAFTDSLQSNPPNVGGGGRTGDNVQ